MSRFPPPPPPIYDTITLSWSTPEYREDGTLLGLEEIDHYNIFNDNEGLDSVDNYTNEYIIEPSEVGVYCFTIEAVDIDGRKSKHSNSVCKTIN